MQIYYSYIDKFYDAQELISLTKHEKEHLLGRKIVADISKSVYGIEDEIVYYGKRPHFKKNEVYFSISHSENLVVVAFDNEPVGVDVEFVKPRNLDKLIKRYELEGKVHNLEEFYGWWTAYEARYKNPSGKFIKTYQILPQYVCTISTNRELKDIKLSNFT